MKNTYDVLHSLGPIEFNITENLINLLPGNVFVVDNEGYLIWGNQRILDTLNLKNFDEYIGKHISYWDNYSWECCQAILKSNKEIIGKEFYKGHYYITKRKPLFSTTGEMVAILGTALDITEQKQAHVAKQEFLQNMAHDIRTPLAGIIGLAQLQEMGLDSLEESKEYGQMIYGAGNQLLELLNAVVNLIDTEHMIDSVKTEPLDLSGLVRELYALMEPSIYTKGLKFQLELDQNLPLIISDRIKLKRALLNLLSNAVKFTQEGDIGFAVKLLGEENNHANIEIKISDTGIGIAKENLDKIYDRFYRAHPSYLAEYSGHGIGLYLVKEILAVLGGKIKVVSEERKGTCFTLDFKFPMANTNSYKTETVQVASEVQPKTAPTDPILIAEDNPVVLRVVKNLLEKAGYEVIATKDGKAALAALKNNCFTWALLDIGLPELKGTEVAKQYREWEKENNKPHLPIFALTGHSVNEVGKECREAGIDQVFTKPLTNKIIQKIKAFIN